LLLAVAGASLLAAALVLVWIVTHDRAEPESPAALSHVHGMGVNPSDSRLYVATHEGLFVLDEDGSAGLVGEGRQDTMGFTVAGRDYFLASGHPAPGRDGPSSLGLIESTDAGVTWEPVSLGGEADFHVLRYAHGLAYGIDALTGQLLVSEDLTRWEARSTEALRDFAVDPTDPDSLMGTGPSGLLRSSDGGRTWEPVAAEPMALLHWSNNGVLWGVGPNGEIYSNDDRGETWEPAIASAGASPAAFTAAGDELFLATDDGRILSSDDWGWNWHEAIRPA
jgi:photosystem II stability/assembly factor-like uncharacterized protein